MNTNKVRVILEAVISTDSPIHELYDMLFNELNSQVNTATNETVSVKIQPIYSRG